MIVNALVALLISACALVGSSSEEVLTIEVAPELVDCRGEAQQRCMQIRMQPNQQWTNFYDRIEGFEYQEGFRYVLRVERTRVTDPVADASGFNWRLLAVLEKVAAS